MLASLAWRNIWRQPMRTALSMLGMAFASALLVFMLSFQLGSYDTMKASMLQIADGFGQFQPLDYKDDPDIERVILNADELLEKARAVPGVTAVAARGNGFAILANGERSFAAAVNGVDATIEPNISTMVSNIIKGRALTGEDVQAIVLGDGLARNLRLDIGDQVTMLGSGLDGSVAADVLTLVGVFKTRVPEIDRQMAQMPLARFQETYLLGDAVNVVALRGKSVADIEAAEADLRVIAAEHGVLFLNWAELRPEVKESIQLDLSTAMLMYVTLVIVVVFIILNTLYMSVLERTREFGVLLALGMKRRQIGRMVWLEIIFLTFVGCGIGMAIGIGVTMYYQDIGISIEGFDEIYAQWGLPSRFFPAMTPFRVLLGPGALVVAIVVMGILPYRRVLSLQAVSAMAK